MGSRHCRRRKSPTSFSSGRSKNYLTSTVGASEAFSCKGIKHTMATITAAAAAATIVLLFQPPSVEAALLLNCDLKCSNSGYCTLEASPSYYAANDGNEEQALIKAALAGELIEKCICPTGFTGVTCDTIVEQCIDQHRRRVCHNGVPCKRVHTNNYGGNDRDQKEQQYTCDCSLAYAISQFAGLMCENPATEYCGDGIQSAKSFCTHGGKCKNDWSPGASSGPVRVNEDGTIDFDDSMTQEGKSSLLFQHAGCRCPPEFEGEHCEYLIGTQPSLSSMEAETESSSSSSPSSKRTIIIVCVIVGIGISCVIFIYILVAKRRKRKKSEIFWRTVDMFVVSNEHDLSLSVESSSLHQSSPSQAVQRVSQQHRTESVSFGEDDGVRKVV